MFSYFNTKQAAIFAIVAIIVAIPLTIALIRQQTQIVNHAAGPSAGILVGLHVTGNTLVNDAGEQVMLRGVDRGDTENYCVHNSTFNAPADLASVHAMQSWHINVVRIPLNEDCWLGINGAPGGESALTYQQDIINYVNLLNQNSLYAIVELHVNAPGTQLSTSQQPMADTDHAPAFWTSVAMTFKGNNSVLFDLYNEPNITTVNANTSNPWQCLRDGCTIVNSGTPWQSVGMQQLVTTVRATGATNILMIGGLHDAQDLSQWLTYKPTDPFNNMAASFHAYGGAYCSQVACLNSIIAPVAQELPVIAGEFGENFQGAGSGDCTTNFVSQLLPWFDSHQVAGYLGWVWMVTQQSCDSLALISDYTGTAHAPNGTFYQQYLVSIVPLTQTPSPSLITPTPTITQQASYHVSGKQILDQNGNPYIPYGVNVGGLMYINWQTNPLQKTLEANVNQEISAANTIWKSNVVRLQIAPALLFATSPFDATYLSEIDHDVTQATNNNLNIILSLQTETTTNTPLPDQQSVSFWQFIANRYKDNSRVFFDIFNEPRYWNGNITQSWDIWQNGGTDTTGNTYIGMQQLVNTIRTTGAQNLIFAEGLATGESLQGLVSDEGTTAHLLTGGNIVYTIHPYFGPQHETQAQWDSWFGNATRELNSPVAVDEWNMIDRNKSGCVPGTFEPAQVPIFLNYLRSLNIGLVAWHLSPGGLIRGDGNITDPWNYAKPTKFDTDNPPSLTCPSSWTFPDADPTVQAAGQLILQYFQQYTAISGTPMPTCTPRPPCLDQHPVCTVPQPIGGWCPSPTGTQGNNFFFTIFLHGIGLGGDNAHPHSTGTQNPLHPQRILTISLYDTNNNLIGQPMQGTITYASASGNFQGTIPIPNIQSGQYLVKVHVDGFLDSFLPGIQTITQSSSQTITLPPVYVVTGDINSDNQLDIQDYNILIGCYGDKLNSSTCPTQYQPSATSSEADILDDDGQVDGADYNEFLRELSIQFGQ